MICQATAAATSAIIAAAPNAQWNAARFGAVWPCTTCVTPTAEITVVRIATPAALPSCRAVLKTVDARPVAAGLIVANAAACDGTKTCAIDRPSAEHQRPHDPQVGVEADERERPDHRGDDRSARSSSRRRGPKFAYSRVANCAPIMTPIASGNVDRPEPSADRPSPSWKNSATR